MSRWSAVLAGMLVFSSMCYSQGPRGGAERTPGERLTTKDCPEVHSDRSVTFRIYAPKAKEVTFYGDWMPRGSSEDMTKDENGIWTVTLGPLPPSVYLYAFTVDGVTNIDPVNPDVKMRTRTAASLVTVPGDRPMVWEPRDVPHGAVSAHWQTSSVIGDTREVYVYTPPGYAQNASKRYPVLFLFHGSGDTPRAWTWPGYVNLILDNLLAEGKVVPMIVVMPWGHTQPAWTPREQRGKNNERYEEYLLKEVIPMVESEYRVADGRDNWAIAGLSMGGGQSVQIGFGNLDRFSAIGAFSSAGPQDFEERFADLLADPEGLNKKLNLVWMACGEDDSIVGRSETIQKALTKHNIEHTYRQTPGAHTWTVWRHHIAEFAPLLFR
jgi:enterochelin esterase-like enzyme